MRAGRFLDREGRREIVLGARLATSLGVEIGDELLVYGIAYSLETAYELFTVVGLARLPEAELERNLAMISITDAQDFFVYDDRVTEVAIRARSADDAEPLRALIAGFLAGDDRGALAGVEVHRWDELLPQLYQLVLLDDIGMYLATRN